jgi:hypothetical protein
VLAALRQQRRVVGVISSSSAAMVFLPAHQSCWRKKRRIVPSLEDAIMTP